MKFQNPSIHRSNVSNSTETWTKSMQIQNVVILSKFEVEFSKVNQVIYFSAPTSIPNMKALTQICFEISCTHDCLILFSKEHKSENGHNSDMKKMGQLFFHEESEISNS